jgi:predicted 3-demethylubiquinone-9 3-methyltransferase (glyoxalase superfamily)
MQTITPFLWYNDQAEEAMKLYVSAFKHSKVVNVTRHRAGGMGPEGKVMSATFEIEGQRLHAFNGGPHFTFTPAISLFVSCETQAEVDELWDKLSAGGEKSRCGWLTDKFGVSWQIIPKALEAALNHPDPAKAKKALDAMLQMTKIDIAALRTATA